MLVDLPDDLAHALLASGVGRAVDDAWPVAEREEPDIVTGWISEREAAMLAGITPGGMAKHRKRGSSPAWRTLHGRLIYRKSEILQWIAARERAGIVRSTGLDGVEGDGAAE